MNKKIVIVLLAVFFAACSNQRYGHIAKVKNHPKKHEVAKKTAEAENTASVKLEEVEETDFLPQTPETVQSVVAVPEQEPLAPKTATTKKNLKKATTQSVNTETKVERGAFKHEVTVSKEKKKNLITAVSGVERGSWLWWILVGVLLVFIGIILPVPIIAPIIWVIGVVLICYGIIVLILG